MARQGLKVTDIAQPSPDVEFYKAKSTTATFVSPAGYQNAHQQ